MSEMARVGRYLMAVALVVFGVQHVMYAGFVATLVPGWIPWHLFWAHFVGVAFFAAALGLVWDRTVALAGTWLGVMFLVFVVTTHLPRIATHIKNGNEGTSGLVALAMCGGAWVIGRTARSKAAENRDPLLRLGTSFFGAAMMAFGILHFVSARYTHRVGPPWLAGHPYWAYVMGALLLATGTAILIEKKVQAASALLAIMLLLFFLIVYVPRLIATPHDPGPWTSGFEILAMAGAAMVLAKSSTKAESN
jgi:uncharacterized membrane protein